MIKAQPESSNRIKYAQVRNTALASGAGVVASIIE
jgi:hypothetical protein